MYMFVYSIVVMTKYMTSTLNTYLRSAVVKSSALCWTGTQSNPVARGTIWYLPRYSILLALSDPWDTKTSTHTHACVRVCVCARSISIPFCVCVCVCVYTYIILFGCVEKKGKKKSYDEKLNSARTAPAGAVVVYDHTRLKWLWWPCGCGGDCCSTYSRQ